MRTEHRGAAYYASQIATVMVKSGKSVAQVEDNSITASMQRIRALFDKHMPTGKLLIQPAYCRSSGTTPKHTPMLDTEQIAAIRADLETMGARQVAKKHGISDTLCYKIKNRKGRFK